MSHLFLIDERGSEEDDEPKKIYNNPEARQKKKPREVPDESQEQYKVRVVPSGKAVQRTRQSSKKPGTGAVVCCERIREGREGAKRLGEAARAAGEQEQQARAGECPPPRGGPQPRVHHLTP